MYHPYEVMKQAYEMEERRKGRDIRQTLAFILLLVVCVAATYLLKHLGII
jgi:hypothetical protein